jgi:hypothetical protein
MLRNAFSAWQNFQSGMQKEANNISCDEAALKLGRKANRLYGKAVCSSGRDKKVILNSKGGKK